MAHKWQPIADLDESDINQPVHEELRHLAEIWREQQTGLDEKQLHIFNEKLKREWAIETGQIEGVYDINHGTTETLIEHGISEQVLTGAVQDSAKTLAMLQDHEHVVDGLFDFVKGGRALSTSYIKEMHAALTKNQETTVGVDAHGKKRNIPLRHGAFKTMPNDPKTPFGEVHEYCPPEHTDSEMDKLIAGYLGHNERDVPPLAAAAWLHHRFTQIHPFQDGNGRVARCLASIIFIKAGWFPLVINRKIRDNYLDALQTADGGDLSALINLFADVQKEFFNCAFDLKIETVIEFAAKKMEWRVQDEKALYRDYQKSSEIANQLAKFSEGRMQKICGILNCKFPKERRSAAYFSSEENISVIIGNNPITKMITERLGYQPDLNAYRAEVSMHIAPGAPARILICFYGAASGEIVCAAFCQIGEYKSLHSSILHPQKMVGSEIILIRRNESFMEIQKRFAPWLEQVLSEGMYMWKENL